MYFYFHTSFKNTIKFIEKYLRYRNNTPERPMSGHKFVTHAQITTRSIGTSDPTLCNLCLDNVRQLVTATFLSLFFAILLEKVELC